ncbi:uncharacterized protein STEHIDRAFT_159036 [Stereum hirsutum FP-91666 SS1]|uniref:uncharacterized protein n=1 Tax=Stereum hirsutum (strain FP-91666) TaxID=721885 RepID=UPI0004449DD1|nr:uncharacterized protein STEHIDRAFT_159036 [Stereum hirsutum FP-91666 SS1]EIM84356.1 hypothetical protein STEHIDRAFT_159036 [Stereum hirsutum FP-91666 SS1]
MSTSATVEPEHQSGEHRLQGRKAESIEISTDPVLNCNHAKLETIGVWLLDALAGLAVCKARGQVVAVGVTITQELVTLHVAENRPVPQNVIDHLEDIVCRKDPRKPPQRSVPPSDLGPRVVAGSNFPSPSPRKFRTAALTRRLRPRAKIRPHREFSGVLCRIKEIRSLTPRIPDSPPYVEDPVLSEKLDDLEERMIKYAWPKLRQRFHKRDDDFNKLLRDVVYEDGNVHAEADRSNPPDDHTLAVRQRLLEDLRNSDTREKLTKLAEALNLMKVLRKVVTPTQRVTVPVRVAMHLLKTLYDEGVVDVLNLCTLYLSRPSYDLARWINKLITPHRNFTSVSRLAMSTSLASLIDSKVEVVAVDPQPPVSISVNITQDTIRQAAQESGWKKDEEKNSTGKSIGDVVLEQVFLDLPNNLRLPRQDVHPTQIQPKYESVYSHCECTLLASLHGQAGLYAYFGVSKLSCALCGECFAAYRSVTKLKINTRGSNSQLIAPWVCPKFSEKNIEMQGRMRASILQKISNGLEALQSAKKARQRFQRSVASDDNYVEPEIKDDELTLANLIMEEVMNA